MLDLAAFQTRMAQALLTGELADLAPAVRADPIVSAQALAVHRNTALHGLVAALRLTYPTVDVLVGQAFFDQAALAFVAEAPPASAWLTPYGSGFPAFLGRYHLAAGLPYLEDVARLDAAIEAVGAEALGQPGSSFDLGEAALVLDASLRLLALDHPALAIRDAVEADQAGIDLTPGRHVVALWREPQGAAVRPLGPLAAAVLDALLGAGDVEAVLAQAGDLSSLQSEIFTAPFARIVAKPQGNTP